MSQNLPDLPLPLLFFASVALTLLRYVVIAGVLFVAFWIAGGRALVQRKIQKRALDVRALLREIAWSVTSMFVFAALGLILRSMREAELTQFYVDVDDYGMLWALLSVPLLLVLHDAYFYWVHRFMHVSKEVFKRVHLVHHLSHDPTPFAMYAFHPIEATIEFAFIPLAMIVLPLHPMSLMAFVLASAAINAYGHLGYEMMPSGFTKHRVLGIFNTSTHHNLHHSSTHYNFGLYFTFWDRVMGTLHPRYHDIFEERAQRPLLTPMEVPEAVVVKMSN
jgi:Delta7-sterol 5-desaturase